MHSTHPSKSIIGTTYNSNNKHNWGNVIQSPQSEHNTTNTSKFNQHSTGLSAIHPHPGNEIRTRATRRRPLPLRRSLPCCFSLECSAQLRPAAPVQASGSPGLWIAGRIINLV